MDPFEEIAGRLARLERTQTAGYTPQLGTSTLQDGSIDQEQTVQIVDENGDPALDDEGLPITKTLTVARFGLQEDGSNTVAVLDGPVPPQPVAPLVTAGPGFISVEWTGEFVDRIEPYLDHDYVGVHIGDAAGFTPTAATQVATLRSPAGEQTTVAVDPGSYYVSLVAVSQAGLWSDPAPYTNGGPDPVNVDTTAREMAQQAIDLANGKNRVVFATTTPDKTKYAAGDTFFKLDTSGSVVGIYRHNGTDWVLSPVEGKSIVAGSITSAQIAANSITANLIAARAITVDNLGVGVFSSSYIIDSDFEGAVPGDGWTFNGAQIIYDYPAGAASGKTYYKLLPYGSMTYDMDVSKLGGAGWDQFVIGGMFRGDGVAEPHFLVDYISIYTLNLKDTLNANTGVAGGVYGTGTMLDSQLWRYGARIFSFTGGNGKPATGTIQVEIKNISATRTLYVDAVVARPVRSGSVEIGQGLLRVLDKSGIPVLVSSPDGTYTQNLEASGFTAKDVAVTSGLKVDSIESYNKTVNKVVVSSPVQATGNLDVGGAMTLRGYPIFCTQRGSVACPGVESIANTSIDIVFPKPMPSASYQVLVTPDNTRVSTAINNKSSAGFTIQVANWSPGPYSGGTLDWVVFG